MIELLEPRRLFSTGALDPTFSGDGLGTITFGGRGLDNVFDSAVQPDGKIVLGGLTNSPEGSDFAIARLNPDATVDTTFGDGGVVSLPLDTPTDTESPCPPCGRGGRRQRPGLSPDRPAPGSGW